VVRVRAFTLILRCSANEGGGTSRFASRLIGDREIVRVQTSRSRSPKEWRSSVTSSEHHVTEAAVLPSEIEQLPNLQGYLKLASSPTWRRVTIAR
jgi:type IV secretion system coupling TraD/TrwB family protein